MYNTASAPHITHLNVHADVHLYKHTGVDANTHIGLYQHTQLLSLHLNCLDPFFKLACEKKTVRKVLTYHIKMRIVLTSLQNML